MWTNPKINWNGLHIDGKYEGDFFGYSDANRIFGNEEHMKKMFVNLYPSVNINQIENTSYSSLSYIYADDVSKLITNLKIMANQLNIRSALSYLNMVAEPVTNGRFLNFTELNAIEMAEAILFDVLNKTHNGRPKLQVSLGRKDVI